MRHLPCESAEQLLEFTMCISTSKNFLVPEKEGSGGIFIPARELIQAGRDRELLADVGTARC